ncbi:MAG: macro domain-containing protein [Firmicutes bacterium]|nr:macro domain-containing protein [Bacillota bacterium]
MPFLLVRNDITKMNVDAVVNPANTRLLQGAGTSRAIFLAAGEYRLTRACRKKGRCPVGEAVMTDGFRLPARYIIHAVGPVWEGGHSGEAELLYKTYLNSLHLAARNGLQSVAFPLLSSGSYGYPKKEAMRVAVTAINDYLLSDDSPDMTVYLVLYDREAVTVSSRLFDSVREYIDDNYIEEHDYSYSCNELSRFGRPAVCSQNVTADEYSFPYGTLQPGQAEALSLEELLEAEGESFADMLLRLIDERGMTDAQAYKKANIDRKLFSKIKNNPGYTPTKKTILAFALALELSKDETDELLMKAGYALSNSSKFDVIITYFIINRIYDVFKINEVLFAYNQPLLGQ